MRFTIGLILFLTTFGLTIRYLCLFIRDRRHGYYRTKHGAHAYWMAVTTLWYLNVWQALTGSMEITHAPGQDLTNAVYQIFSVAVFAIYVYTLAFITRMLFKLFMGIVHRVHRKMADDGIIKYSRRERNI